MSSGTDDPRESLYVWLTDSHNRTLVLLVAAGVLGLASIARFFVTDSMAPSRPQFVLILAAMAVLFYVSLRSTV